MTHSIPADLPAQVRAALAEDIGNGDITAALIPADRSAFARVISRDTAVICGQPWVDEVFRQIDPGVEINWHVGEGDCVSADTALCSLRGGARALLSGERTALNFLQMLSGTATATRAYVDAIEGSGARVVDTRKTLPGLRSAQKYAVRRGGGVNHRMGLYDAILIKENHVEAAGGLQQAIAGARALRVKAPLIAEAETLDEAQVALAADVDVLLVDDFDLAALRTAVDWTRRHRAEGGRSLIEYSGNTTLDRIRSIAETGVDRISVGALTKHLHAVDLSMRFIARAD